MEIPDFIQQVTLPQWGIAGAFLAAMLFMWRDKLPAVPSFGDGDDPNVRALNALKVLEAHYAECPEGKAALKVLKVHFLDHGGDEA